MGKKTNTKPKTNLDTAKEEDIKVLFEYIKEIKAMSIEDYALKLSMSLTCNNCPADCDPTELGAPTDDADDVCISRLINYLRKEAKP